MTYHSDRILPVQVYALPTLQNDVESLESFLAAKEVLFGLPLFELSIEIGFCRSLITSVHTLEEVAQGLEKKHNQVVGSLKLLRNRLSLIYEVFLHGRKCCVGDIQDQSGGGELHFFNVRDEYTNLESYCSKSSNPSDLPLLAVCASLNGCLSFLENILFSADDDRFFGAGTRGVSDCLSIICSQLYMVNTVVESAEDSTVRLSSGGVS